MKELRSETMIDTAAGEIWSVLRDLDNYSSWNPFGHLFVRGLFDGEHIFEIEPLGENRCRFVQRERFRGVLVPLLWNNVSKTTRKGFEAMNSALKERAEAR